MSLNLSFPLSKRTCAIVVSGILIIFAFVFMALCLSQLGAWPPMESGAQAAAAIASISQVLLVGLASTIIFASWIESSRLIRFSAYGTVAHLALNVTVLAWLLTAVTSTVPCQAGDMRCSKLVAPKPTWVGLSAVILIVQPCLSLIVFSYSFHLQDHSRRPYSPEIYSRSLSVPTSSKPDYKRLPSNSEPWPNVEMGVVEPVPTARSFKSPEPEVGYGGGMRTYEEAEENEKARLRREMEMGNEGNRIISSPIASMSRTGVLTPLGLQWRDGDLPPYAS
ncbi:hypothetical protein BJ322DRAFT_12140 [Thelephora terrestris]|uniref:MARVEL domain-containing protein n=1 Tax=Thelephora terrestris TaxID=56493 RepID=A0A9P6LC42_9AGAM|nr:hypothetical protein BJ322DRAFT_12140 [Thelephora terrestris]